MSNIQYTLNDHPLHQAIYDLCQELEKFPPSEHATKLVTIAGALQQPVASLRADLAAAQAEVSKLTDALDMMKDEFMRIIACPGCNAEIEDLANRAQLKLVQHVPVIVQRDRAQAELAALREDRERLDWLLTNCSSFVAQDFTTGNRDLYSVDATREAIDRAIGARKEKKL